jgi:plasmid stabilization system protein ParE
MKLSLHRADDFNSDFRHQYDWYLHEASEDIAENFLEAVQSTLQRLLTHPDLGRKLKYRNPKLSNIQLFRVDAPFHRLSIFYRHDGKVLSVERLMHGARDLPRRLTEPPGR